VLVLPQGSDVAERLAGRIGADNCFTHPPAPPVWQEGAIPLALGPEDRDIVGRRPGLWPSGVLPARHRLRRIDTLYPDRPIGLLVLADPPTAAGVLRPAVLLDLRAIPAPQAQAVRVAALAELPGYNWVEGLGPTPCALPDGDSAHALHDLARANADTVDAVFDHRLVCSGLHRPEHDAPHGGRWTGAGYATWFMLPRPAAGQWMLRLDIADWGNAVAGFDAGIDSRRLSPTRLTADAAEYGPFGLVQAAGAVLRVDLFPPRAARDMQRGPRRIGLRILRAILSRVA